MPDESRGQFTYSGLEPATDEADWSSIPAFYAQVDMNQWPDDLADVRAKLRRAEKHYLELDSAQKAWFQDHPSPSKSRHELDEPAWELRIRLEHDPIPDDWSAIFGDLVNNVRTALDYLIVAAIEHNSQPVPNQCYWPSPAVEPTKGALATLNKILACLTAEHREIVEVNQPYASTLPRSQPLFVLRDLSNADKHRALLPRFTSPLAETMRQCGNLWMMSPIYFDEAADFVDAPDIRNTTMPIREPDGRITRLDIVGPPRPEDPDDVAFRVSNRVLLFPPPPYDPTPMRYNICFGAKDRPVDLHRMAKITAEVLMLVDQFAQTW